MQLASGLSFALSTSKRCFRMSGAHGVYGRPPVMLPPASKNVATGGPFGSNGKRSVCGSSVTPPRPPPKAAPVSPPRGAPRPAAAAGAAWRRWRSRSRRRSAPRRPRRRRAGAAPASAASSFGRTAVGAHPHAGKVDLAVGRPRRRRILAYVALRVPRDARIGNLAPLRRDGHGTGHHHANHAVSCLRLLNACETPCRAPGGRGELVG